MANKKKEYFKPGPMTEGKRSIIQGLLEEYDIKSASDIQEALKDLLGGTIKEMMETEMEDHLGYEKSARSENEDSRNGYKSKRLTTSYGPIKRGGGAVRLPLDAREDRDLDLRVGVVHRHFPPRKSRARSTNGSAQMA